MDVRGFRTAAFLTGMLILLAAVQPLAAVELSSSRSDELLAQEGAPDSEESGDRSCTWSPRFMRLRAHPMRQRASPGS